MRMEFLYAGEIVSEEEKICTICEEKKSKLRDFYICKGYVRSECKACTIKRNSAYGKKNKTWQNRSVDREATREYMQEYYAKNRYKFAEYRQKFKEKHPNYYQDYKTKKQER